MNQTLEILPLSHSVLKGWINLGISVLGCEYISNGKSPKCLIYSIEQLSLPNQLSIFIYFNEFIHTLCTRKLMYKYAV